jgi:hypothetical protein
MDEEELVRTANGYQPNSSQILTEGYQPQGSSTLPAVVPRLVSGVCAPTMSPPPPAYDHRAAAGETHCDE